MAHPKVVELYNKYRPEGKFIWPESQTEFDPTPEEIEVFTKELSDCMDEVGFNEFDEYVKQRQQEEIELGLVEVKDEPAVPTDEEIAQNPIHQFRKAHINLEYDFDEGNNIEETQMYWDEVAEVMDNATEKERNQFMIWIGNSRNGMFEEDFE